MRLAVFTDAPAELARVALAQLGAARRVDAVEAGAGALERLGGDVTVVRSRDELLASARARLTHMEAKEMPDRQFEAVLERLDRIADELARLNRQAEHAEGFQLMARELRNLNESLNALAYAALGQSPRVSRAK